MKQELLTGLSLALLVFPLAGKKQPSGATQPSLDEYVQEVTQRSHQSSSTTPGSLFVPTGRLADGVRDVRASQLYDLITIVVLANSSSTSKAVTNTARKSSV